MTHEEKSKEERKTNQKATWRDSSKKENEPP
jgi:hypothetical protein